MELESLCSSWYITFTGKPTQHASHIEFAFVLEIGVVINLGTNDFSTAPHPPADIFIPAYRAFIRRIRTGLSSKSAMRMGSQLINSRLLNDSV
jgi:hypothetical protein